MTSTFGGIVAYVFDTSESVSVTEKFVKENEKSEIESIFAGIHWQ